MMCSLQIFITGFPWIDLSEIDLRSIHGKPVNAFSLLGLLFIYTNRMYYKRATLALTYILNRKYSDIFTYYNYVENIVL